MGLKSCDDGSGSAKPKFLYHILDFKLFSTGQNVSEIVASMETSFPNASLKDAYCIVNDSSKVGLVTKYD